MRRFILTLLILFLPTVCFSAHSLSDSNLMGCWYWDNNSNDSAVAGNNLTCYNSPSYETATPDPQQGTHSVHFTGVSNEYCASADSDFDADDTMSFGGWLYPEVDDVAMNVGGKHAGSPNFGWRFSLLGHLTDQICVAYSHDGTTWSSTLSGEDNFAPTTWYHMVFVTDGSYIRMYVDGSEYTAGNFPAEWSSGINNSTGEFQIGDHYGQEPWDGNMDEMFYTNDALTATEISDIYNNGFVSPKAQTIVITGWLKEEWRKLKRAWKHEMVWNYFHYRLSAMVSW